MAKKSANAPKNERAAQARKQAQSQVRASERRTAIMIGAGALVAVLLFGGLVFFIVQQSDVPSLGSDNLASPTGADDSGGILVGSDGLAGGEAPADAPVVRVYADYLCPYCANFEGVNAEDLDDMRASGDIQLYYHPIAILSARAGSDQFSTRAANAAVTVADGAPELFVDFNNALFANQPSDPPQLTDEQIEQLALEVGVPQDVVDRFGDGEFTRWVLAATERSSQDGITGTPAVIVDDTQVNPMEVAYTTTPGALRSFIETL